MAELRDGESTQVAGSGSSRYTLKNVGQVLSCSCPAWRNQNAAIERRTCKHLRAYLGDAAETARVGATAAVPVKAAKAGAPQLLLAHSWNDGIDPSGWWASVKLDGLRAYWDGTQLISRLGNRFHAPDWFLAGLPAVPLDGELWIGPGQFQRTSGLVRRQDQHQHWAEIRYMVFDLPGSPDPFERRQREIDRIVAVNRPPYALAHQQQRCRDQDHLLELLDRYTAQGEEGLMLREPESLYVAGRSRTLLKVKKFMTDTALVVGYEPGRGKHKGRVGALVCQLADGAQFNVGTGLTDRERESPPPLGALIDVRYFELTEDRKPRFPSFLGVRIDAVLTPATPKSKPKPQEKTVTQTAESTRLECTENGSDKFYDIHADGQTVVVRYGKNGTAGQSQIKSFATAAAANDFVIKQVAAKLKKGYRRV